MRACYVCLAISVCVSKRKRRGMSIAKGGWGWKERGSKEKEGEEANSASTYTSPQPIAVTHLPFTRYITLYFRCLQSLGKEITINISAAAMAFSKKKTRDILCLKCI